MSTYNALFKMRKGAGLSALSVLGGLLVMLITALFSFLSPAAFASSSARLATTPPPQAITRAGVAVVRLVAQYTSAAQSSSSQAKGTPIVVAPPASVACTGPGVLVGDWASSNATPANTNVWILTDDALLDSAGRATCATMPPKAVLSTVTVFFSSTYNGTTLPPLQVSQVGINVLRDCPTQDAVQTQCASSAVLFSFNDSSLGGKLYPYLDVFASDETQQTAIALSGSATALQKPDPHAPDPRAIASSFLIPFASASSTRTASNLEAGTPLVNTTGELTGMQLKAGDLTATALKTFVSAHVSGLQQAGTNAVHQQWVAGLAAFYKQPNPDYTVARTAFAAAFTANSDFQEANTLAQTAQSLAPPSGPAATPTPSPSGGGLSQITNNLSIPVLILIGAGIILFIVLLVLLSRTFSKGRSRSQQLKEDMAEAERRSHVDAQRIAALESHPPAPTPLPQQAATTQQLQPTLVLPPMQPSSPASNNVVRASTPPAPSTFPCPHCGTAVQRGMARCPNCRQPFSLTDSGVFKSVQPSAAPPAAIPQQPFPIPASSPASNIADYPTYFEMSPSLQRPPNEMSPVWNQPIPVDNEKTITNPPIAARQVRLNRLGFAVGTRTNPGIKRKFKPNEDSFFAAEGIRAGDASLQQVGLFVVADGMGGHANGQDASRRAIQTIIEYILPRLTHNGDASDEQFAQLLVDGIKRANQEVHRHNQEEHADTGTTVTGALVVGMTAYVANVGDSRTYLYRQGEKLRKVTSDHSVVASLVQAGIIKDDDIYTHPKRNQIYRSLGEKPDVDVDHFIEPLQIGDKLLLCSDGLWDMVRDPRIEDVLKAPMPDPNMTGEALIEAALAGGGEDNVSVIVVEIIDNPVANGKIGIQLINKSETVQMLQL